jgi:thymidylate synthase (FAD)
MITVIEPDWDWISPPPDRVEVYKHLEACARTCYKSEHCVTEDSAERIIKKLIKSKHESVLEHISISVRIICDRSCSHQLVRHRIAAYSQESQRYCNYGKKGLQVICPPSIGVKPGAYQKYGNEWTPVPAHPSWLETTNRCYLEYLALLDQGKPPEDARSVLQNNCKTEVATTFNLRTWRHVFVERGLNKHAQWQIRGIFSDILRDFASRYPAIFGDLYGGSEPPAEIHLFNEPKDGFESNARLAA